MTFLDQIFDSLDRSGDAVVLQELHDGQPVSLTARQLLAEVLEAQGYLRRLRLTKGDRCALLAHNSMRWVAMDLAIMAEGLTVVPLYARQSPAELVAIMKDCRPAAIACGDQSLADAITELWPEAPPQLCFESIGASGREPINHQHRVHVELHLGAA
jgi:long-subunit acyl-CoA synthetase (AMP-forming)